MEDIQAKLEQYRLRKRRRQKLDAIKQKITNFLMPESANKDIFIQIKEKPTDDPPNESYSKPADEKTSDTISELSDEDEKLFNSSSTSENRLFKYTLRIIYFLFWTTLYIIAIELKFGIVFLMLSALVGIYLNTRTGPKNENEISAYSVFNKNCESIDGTLKAEQFERDLFYRADTMK